MVRCRLLRPEDREAWLTMRRALWPDADAEDAIHWEQRGDAVTLLAETAPGAYAGFIEVGERAYADGCDTGPVAYLEGWYVVPEFRRQGVGALLLAAAEDWARACGHRELASDALLENLESQTVHRATGFEEVERAVRYRKSLAPGQADGSAS